MRGPEVWLYNLDGYVAEALEHGEYVPIQTSRVIAGLPIAEMHYGSRESRYALVQILDTRATTP